MLQSFGFLLITISSYHHIIILLYTRSFGFHSCHHIFCLLLITISSYHHIIILLYMQSFGFLLITIVS